MKNIVKIMLGVAIITLASFTLFVMADGSDATAVADSNVTINYDANGTSAVMPEPTVASSVTGEPTHIRVSSSRISSIDDKVFLGWSKDTAGTELIGIGQEITITGGESCTLYAIFGVAELVNITITFDHNGYSCEQSTPNLITTGPKDCKMSIKLPMTYLENTLEPDRRFFGWCVSQDGFGKKYFPGQYLDVTFGHDVTLYATFTAADPDFSYLIYNQNWHHFTFKDIDHTILEHNTLGKIQVSEKVPESGDSKFLGWSYKKYGEPVVQPGQWIDIRSGESKVLYAVFEGDKIITDSGTDPIVPDNTTDTNTTITNEESSNLFEDPIILILLVCLIAVGGLMASRRHF